ncbi:MAG: hypothetical protein JZU50_08290 [Desulfobulbaceae bacterium]|jgi:hypothetical protein|nr:hypothetical protein [Desulfobulbaceae bacterium]
MKIKLAIEAVRRDARHQVGLSQEKAQHLADQVQPLATIVESFKVEKEGIQRNGMLSDQGKRLQVEQATAAANEKIVAHAAGLSKETMIADHEQRINTKVTAERVKAKAMIEDGAELGRELRQNVLPKAIATTAPLRKPEEVVRRMVVKAAQDYATNPSRSELIIKSLSIGQPFCPELPIGTLDEVNANIAQAVAPDQVAALSEIKGVHSLIMIAADAALQSIKELG